VRNVINAAAAPEPEPAREPATPVVSRTAGEAYSA
jgi:hypothetical protein